MGQLVTAQKVATRASAAARPGSSPSSGPTRQPKVEPTKKVGTISPPRKPHPRVMAVSSSLRMKAAGCTSSPSVMARSTTSMPAPL